MDRPSIVEHVAERVLSTSWPPDAERMVLAMARSWPEGVPTGQLLAEITDVTGLAPDRARRLLACALAGGTIAASADGTRVRAVQPPADRPGGPARVR